ncbi:Elongation of very long chain fatty acids protein-like 2 [Homarus americanus]|uniref:Elongation of very long chain fatty acids protein n=1 Tax=Homarus americanus TaxID=6706 RepID=A0A8J5N3E2_HOMAM|nr:Elongation of very long chain fatty acids protein-like 2 [Homarus americanus]
MEGKSIALGLHFTQSCSSAVVDEATGNSEAVHYSPGSSPNVPVIDDIKGPQTNTRVVRKIKYQAKLFAVRVLKLAELDGSSGSGVPVSCHPRMTTSQEAALPTPRSCPQQYEKDSLQELRTIGKQVAVLIVLSYTYGDVMVYRKLTPDPRQDTWYLMRSPLPTIITCFLYVAAVTWCIPHYMSTRKPVSGLRTSMMAYNAFQVVFSAWIFWESGVAGWFGDYSLVCQRCDFSDNTEAVRVFFALHKKNEHISLLHVCHHAIMPVCMWYGIRYYSGGHTTLAFLLNSFVHTVMYLYYLLAAMGPRVRPFLWWKKYLTTLQMVQFTAILIHNFLALFVECPVPSSLIAWVSGVSLLFFVLFADFYIKTYRKRGKH